MVDGCASVAAAAASGLQVLLFDLHTICWGFGAISWLVMFALTGALSGLGALGTLLADRVSPGAPQRVMAPG
ncbi:hypothetical protein M8494_25270 [Serratia ureilytica]